MPFGSTRLFEKKKLARGLTVLVTWKHHSRQTTWYLFPIPFRVKGDNMAIAGGWRSC